jgi:hypothetical protein
MFLTYQNALVMAGTWGLLETVTRALPKVFTLQVTVRFLPFASLVICSAAVWIPGVVPSDMPIGIRVFLGINLGVWAGWFYKVWKQTIRGRDARLPAKDDGAQPPPGDTTGRTP